MKLENVTDQINSDLHCLNIYNLIADRAERNPNAIAIAAPDRKPLTYSRLHAHISEVVKTLNTMGLGRGDRIAIVLPNGSEMVVAFLAVTACATSAPLNPAYLASEFDFYLSDLNPKALIVQSGIESPALAVAQALNIPLVELVPMLEAEAGIFRLTGNLDAPIVTHLATSSLTKVSNSFAQPEDVAVVLHISETTSQPKIVPVTQSNLCTSAHNIKVALKLHSGDRCLNVMPLFHIHGLSGLVSSLTAGGSFVCTPGFDTAEEANLDSITQILTKLEALSQEDAQRLLANAMRFKQILQQQDSDFSRKALQSQLDYWKQRLGGNLPMLELPTDRPRPPVLSFQSARHFLKLPLALTEALKQLSQREGVTLYMTVLAAFKTLLYRYSGQEDILVGSAIANLKQIEIGQLQRYFANILVMRTDLSGNPTFGELLSRVREVALEAYAHQDLPFEKLVEELHLKRDSSPSPLFQVMFALQNAPDMADLTLSPLSGDSTKAKFDLILDLSERSEGLSGWFGYNTDLFDAATIARMSGHLQTLLEGIVAQPEQRLGELPILSADERHQLLVEWNQTQTNYPQDICVHQLFEAQVERTPDAIAVVFENQQLTYRELNSRANKIAHYLKTLGVGPDVLVGIYVERSVELVVGLLGILKAGGAYVPLDPAYPQERLAFILADAQVPVLLTQQRLVERLLNDNSNAKVVLLDTDWETIAQAQANNLVSGVTDDNLAYVIYTSGSTGKPKGTLIPHRGLVNYLIWCIQAYAVADGEGAPVHSSISFDLTITGLFSPLLVGLRVEMLPETMGIEALGMALRNGANFSLVKITPAQLDLLRHQLSPQEVAF
jgi:non-ribosomal peptide synthetase component F